MVGLVVLSFLVLPFTLLFLLFVMFGTGVWRFGTEVWGSQSADGVWRSQIWRSQSADGIWRWWGSVGSALARLGRYAEIGSLCRDWVAILVAGEGFCEFQRCRDWVAILVVGG